nr:hypothetical protein [Pandoravirus aubagnensis]
MHTARVILGWPQFFASVSFFRAKAPLGVLSLFFFRVLPFRPVVYFLSNQNTKRQRHIHAKKHDAIFLSCGPLRFLSHHHLAKKENTSTKDGPVIGTPRVDPPLVPCFCCKWKIPTLAMCLFFFMIYFV